MLSTIDGFIDALLHPSVRGKPLLIARHRAFIVPRLFGGLAVLAAVPLYLAFRGAPDGLEVLIFAWLVTPVLLACFLATTARYEAAHILSSLSIVALVAAIAMWTGSVAIAAAWLVLIPLEASLSSSRRVVGLSIAIAVGTAALLGVAFAVGLPADSTGGSHGLLSVLGIMVATLYAGGIAFGAPAQTGIGVDLLSSEEERYRLLARNMSDVISRHSRNGDVLFVSPAAELVFGVPVGALMGHGLFERVHVADRPSYLKALADAAHGEDVGSVEFRVRRDAKSGGDFIWVEMRCRPFTDASGVSEVVAEMRDVTGRRMQEDQLDGARAEAERANAAKSRFLATMSHELRTPLNAIIGFSEMIMRENELMLDAARRQEYSRLINDSGHHLLSVVNGILDMSKIESGTFEISSEPFAPREAIITCCDLMVLKAREGGVGLSVRVPEALPMMVGDKRALKQVLLNLLSNAIKFTPRDGTVTVSAAVEGAQLVLQVEDEGVGIGAEDLKRLGDPFFQAGKTYQRRHEGTGLGLSIVKGLITLHAGEFAIQSRVDAGTKVTVRLPLVFEGGRKPVATIATLAPVREASQSEQVRKRA